MPASRSSRSSRSARGSRASAPRGLLLPAIALVVVAGLGLAAWTGGGDETASGGGVDRPETVDELDELLASLERREEGDPLALGEVDAPVLMIEWADFQCPFCASFARETTPELEPYLDDGTLRIEWRDLPLQGEESRTAALGGRAAADQGSFWELHDEIYAEDRARNAGELDRDALVEMADRLGLDTDRFEAAFDDRRHLGAVEADAQLARSLGITGTPAFLINGQPLLGGQPTETFVAAIEQAAAEADAS